MTVWLDNERPYRRCFALSVGACERPERVCSLELSGSVARPRLYEVDAGGKLLDRAITLQPDGAGLLFHLKGRTAAGTTRHYQLYFDEHGAADDLPIAPAPVALATGLEHEGFESACITTPNATWYYHLTGGGFSGLIDGDGADWISFHPWGGSDGNFRGIPNLVHPESYFHPGRTGCSSEILAAGPLRVTILSRSQDDAWACEWAIDPDCARLTVLKAARPYWLLYEGTPGGILDEQGDFMWLSDGRRIPASERWEYSLPEPGWIAFGAENSPRALWLLRHEPDGESDSYWPMEGQMTVFGFGRSGLHKSLTRAPAQFSVGLSERNDFETLGQVITSASMAPQIQFGQVEKRQ